MIKKTKGKNSRPLADNPASSCNITANENKEHKKLNMLTTVGALFAAIVASACCWLPVLLITLGLSAAGVSTIFENLRPYFIAVTVILLGVGFYFAYRKPAETSDCCAPDKNRLRQKRFKLVMWIIAIVAVVAMTYPYYGASLIRMNNLPKSENLNNGVTYSTANLKIKGMTCQGCSAAIENNLNKTQGVKSSSVDYNSGKAEVQFDANRVKVDELLNIINKTGYQATLE